MTLWRTNPTGWLLAPLGLMQPEETDRAEMAYHYQGLSDDDRACLFYLTDYSKELKVMGQPGPR